MKCLSISVLCSVIICAPSSAQTLSRKTNLRFTKTLSCSESGNCAEKNNRDTLNPYLHGTGYAYAPAVFVEQEDKGSTFHMFYCSLGINPNNPHDSSRAQPGDAIRYASSKDQGATWVTSSILEGGSRSKSALMIQAKHFGGKQDRDACDPTVFKRGNFFYLFYGSAQNEKGVIQVARSKNINGPYRIYTNKGWIRQDHPDSQVPQPLITSENPNSSAIFTGAAQPSVLTGPAEKGSSRYGIYLYYFDNSSGAPSTFRVELDPNTLLPKPGSRQKIRVQNSQSLINADIKFDFSTQKFRAIFLINELSILSSLMVSESDDGIDWTEPRHVANYGSGNGNYLYRYASNAAVLSNEYGIMASGNGVPVYVSYAEDSPTTTDLAASNNNPWDRGLNSTATQSTSPKIWVGLYMKPHPTDPNYNLYTLEDIASVRPHNPEVDCSGTQTSETNCYGAVNSQSPRPGSGGHFALQKGWGALSTVGGFWHSETLTDLSRSTYPLQELTSHLHPQTGDTFFTHLATRIPQGYLKQNKKLYLSRNAFPGSIPLIRLRNRISGFHRYVVSHKAADFLKSNNFHEKTVLGYVAPPFQEPNWGYFEIYQSWMNVNP